MGERSADATWLRLTRWQLEEPVDSAEPARSGAHAGAEYTLQTLVAVGGMGEVWEAVQTALGRVVAVKRLQPDKRGTHLEAMFQQEAILTASLEHPNIVPVYDLGRADNGSALAMKRVRGRAWPEVLRADFATLSALEFLARQLPVLIQVSQAVAFAHSRGVVHRDLKPSQVMVGEFGEVLLMDWGLAMYLDAARAQATTAATGIAMPGPATASSPAGTPAYMAPEQTEDSALRIGPWTDVYQLGGLLYELLTGTPPHRGTPEALRERARRGTLDPPESRNPGREVPLELWQLVQRASQPDPSVRLASALQFRDALQDYLSGAGKRRESLELTRQVQQQLELAGRAASDARAAEPSYRVLAECAFTLARAQGLWPGNPDTLPLRQRVQGDYAREALAHGDLVLARLQAERLEPGELRNALLAQVEARRQVQRRAQRQRRLLLGVALASLALLAGGALLYSRNQRLALARADRARADAEGLIGFMLGDLRLKLEPIGRLDALDAAARESLSYYEKLPPHEVDDALRGRHADALTRVAAVRWSQGDIDAAIDLYARSIALSEAVLAQAPQDAGVRLHLAEASAAIGEGHFTRGRFEPALAHERRAVAEFEALVAAAPDDVALQRQLVGARALLGRVLSVTNDLAAARVCFEANRTLLLRLTAQHPGETGLRADLSTAHDDMGTLLDRLGDIDGAIEQARRSVEVQQELVTSDSRQTAWRRDLAVGLSNLSGLLRDRRDFTEATRTAWDAVRHQQILAQFDPANTGWQVDLASARVDLAMCLLDLGKRGEARQTLDPALHVLLSQLAKAPQDAQMRRRSSNARVLMGRILDGQGESREARAQWQAVVETLQPLTIRDDRFALELQVEALLRLDRTAEARPLAARLLPLGPSRDVLALLKQRGVTD